jgi:hypothetical protein
MNTAERRTARRDGNRSSTSVPEVRMDGNKLATIPEVGVVDEGILAIDGDIPSIRSRISDAFDELSADERDLIMDALGIDLAIALPNSEIALKWECSEEVAAQMVEAAFEQIRQILSKKPTPQAG